MAGWFWFGVFQVAAIRQGLEQVHCGGECQGEEGDGAAEVAGHLSLFTLSQSLSMWSLHTWTSLSCLAALQPQNGMQGD